MTPKEKAFELIDKYNKLDKAHNRVDVFYHDSKNCALIAVDEIVKIFESQMPPLTANYWKQVKEEVKQFVI